MAIRAHHFACRYLTIRQEYLHDLLLRNICWQPRYKEAVVRLRWPLLRLTAHASLSPSSTQGCLVLALDRVPRRCKLNNHAWHQLQSRRNLVFVNHDIIATINRDNEAKRLVLHPHLDGPLPQVRWRLWRCIAARGRSGIAASVTSRSGGSIATGQHTPAGHSLALRSVPTFLEENLLVWHQGLSIYQGTPVHEDILTTIIRCKEAHTFLLVPRLNDARHHRRRVSLPWRSVASDLWWC
mmetsp:Transcript_41173/g.74392  ORF Transcript_41173/g.74392 Transcript_41173/m.74392 type:complete len:239 (-) Transcript_41173:1012-1728(-)